MGTEVKQTVKFAIYTVHLKKTRHERNYNTVAIGSIVPIVFVLKLRKPFVNL